MKESNYYVDIVKEAYKQALDSAIDVLKNSKGRYIAIPNWEDEFAAISDNDVQISVWGVGVNDAGHICIRAFVDNVGYGHSEDDFPQEWVDITEEGINVSCYPELYRFVVDNIEKATSLEEALKVEDEWE